MCVQECVSDVDVKVHFCESQKMFVSHWSHVVNFHKVNLQELFYEVVIPIYAPTNRVPTNLPLYLLFWEFIVFDNLMSIKMLPRWALICMAVTTHGFEYLYIASFTILSVFSEILACVLCPVFYCFVGLFLKICRTLHNLCINPYWLHELWVSSGLWLSFSFSLWCLMSHGSSSF